VTKNNLSKADLSKNLSKLKGYPISFSNKLINDLLDTLNEAIKLDYLTLKNFGSFKLVKKKERIGRNPKTKEKFIIKSRKSISFIVSKKLLNKINIKL
jgi:integration host factor subunit alpha|tara:strand:+ start:214 stop:507 length:294 start_codon:yes stop_codon:yes gene_type:complete